ncbi:hypothetical protein DSC45_06200 [Streptomyces sp. YIM 130001]|uniref:hypothetical protein n=1 Tax=Streptomyces sp. YIM 130001 TaxID=2259644 RepID=UPI000ECE9D53|nr:hypothetical protein [Streptomyces sp. YIM 130001]RII19586.1 hypothetical protein DSC45_06200 [Streptomyces sp. YIM 130001]
MAVAKLIFAAPSTAHPMAASGFGKQSVPGQGPRRRTDFEALSPVAAAVAAYVDRLPDGADISIKGLAAQLPRGQAAIGTALRELARTGHLRRIRERVAADGASQWVTRTHFSRVARGDDWWGAYVEGQDMGAWSPAPRGAEDAYGETAEPRTPSGPEPRTAVDHRTPSVTPPPSEAYSLLAEVGLVDVRLSLSAADCTALAPLVEDWLRRGATRDRIMHVLTSGLPPEVHSPRRVTEIRLTEKLPPALPPRPPAVRMLECVTCRAPGSPEALSGGECAACRGDQPPQPPMPVRPEAIRHYAAEARRAAKTPPHPSPPRGGDLAASGHAS